MIINSTTALSVSDLNATVAQLLQAQLPMLRVRGEAQGVKRYPSGHVYFTLKDGTASVSCVMFKMRAQLFDRLPREGELIELRAKVTLYEPRGDYQLRVDGWQAAGQGALYEAFLQLKAKLSAEGLLDEARKRALPVFPKRVGIITSPHAAVLRDVATALLRRAPHVELVLYPCAVQGAEAGTQLANTVREVSQRAQKDQLDVLIICRGGGSMEDLWCFNDEQLVRAIANCPIPVISGVGHETDFTLCDFVADVRAPTPTAAAELCATARSDWLAELGSIAESLRNMMYEQLARKQQHLDHAQHRLAQASPIKRLEQQTVALEQKRKQLRWTMRSYLEQHDYAIKSAAQRLKLPTLTVHQQALSSIHLRLQQASLAQLVDKQNALKICTASLTALNPQRVLERGYAVVLDSQGEALTAPGKLGDQVKIRYADGAQSAVLGE